VKNNDFPVPESLANSFLDAFVDDIKGRSKDKKLPRGFDEEKFRSESREYAVWQAKWLLLRQHIMDVEGITVDDGELRQFAETEATAMGVDAARLFEYFKTSHTGTERLLTNKMMAFLKARVTITEKVVEESPT
jgi:FKBP-type peptidyl-prolyl cis-trans isomerase (trigger factor)